MTRAFFRQLARCERGANSIEYAMIAVILGIALIGTMLTLGNGVEDHYETVGTDYSEAANKARD